MEAEILFREFRMTREPAALGAVFDLVVDDLLAVARHLSRDQDDAEDLVQATFLVAIERAERWDAARPLRPWLLGILHREAKERRRRARRTPEPGRLVRRAEEPPVQRALAAEVAHAVAVAITHLPQPYREVLELRFVQSLPNREIAARLARSPGAVRTQVWRGLELLRALLPAGLALTVASQVGAEAGLAAVRQRVLDAASAKAGAAAAGVAAGALVMKEIAVGVAAAVVLAAGWLVWQMPRADLAVRDTAAETTALAASDMTPSRDALPARDVITETAVPPQAQIDAPVEGIVAQLTVRGRCVDADTNTPIAGCDLQLQGSPRNGEGADVFVEPKMAKTDELGTFALSFAPRAGYYFRLTFESAEHLGRSAEWRRTEPGEVDLGDVPLEIGCGVRGTIVDTHGAAQAGVDLQVDRDDGAYGGEGLLPMQGDSSRSRADGSFALRVPVGRWRLRVQERQLVSSDLLTIEEGQRALDLSVTTRALDEIETITGVLVDETGAPVGGVSVHFEGFVGRGFGNRTKNDGRFRIERPPGSSADPVQLSFLSWERKHEPLTTDEKYPWGTTDLHLVMQRKLTAEIEVVDAETGASIEDYGVRCFATLKPLGPNTYTPSDFDVREPGTHPNGKLRIDRVARGSNTLVVHPADRAWDNTKIIEFDGDDLGARALRVELPRNVALRVRVATRDGAPCAGSEVELLRACVPPLGNPTVEPIDLSTVALVPGKTMSAYPIRALFVDSGSTDPEGVVTLHGPPGVALVLRALGPGHVACFREVTLVPAGEIDVAVDQGATLTGTIGPTRLLDKLRGGDPYRGLGKPGLRLVRSEGTPRSLPVGLSRFPVGADGSFRWSAIPEGNWNACLQFDVATPGERGSSGSTHSRSELLGTLDLREGETRSVQWSLDGLFPGRIAGRVLLDGAVPSDARVWLERRKPDGSRDQGEIAASAPVDAAGAFTVEAFPATYALDLRFKRSEQEHTLPARETVTVTTDATVEQTFTVQSARARVRLRTSAGAPLAGVELSAATPDNRWQSSLPPTDTDGWTILDLAPPGRLELTTRPKRLSDAQAWTEFWRANQGDSTAWDRSRVVVGQIDLRAGTPTEVDLVMPESAGY